MTLRRSILPVLPVALLVALSVAACTWKPRRVETPGAFLQEPSGPQFPPGPLPIGEPAPRFELFDIEGELVRLADYEGRVVVIEWFNPDCPFVRHAHSRGTLVGVPAALADDGIAWIAINSGAPDKHGTDLKAGRAFAAENGLEFPILMDPTGVVGRAFGAERTPQVFVLDPTLRLAWSGPPDDAPFGKVPGGDVPERYVEEAVAAVLDGRSPRIDAREPYGCAVKYGEVSHTAP